MTFLGPNPNLSLFLLCVLIFILVPPVCLFVQYIYPPTIPVKTHKQTRIDKQPRLPDSTLTAHSSPIPKKQSPSEGVETKITGMNSSSETQHVPTAKSAPHLPMYPSMCATKLYAPLLAASEKDHGNAAISAYNIASAFAMLAEGASGTALRELVTFFGFHTGALPTGDDNRTITLDTSRLLRAQQVLTSKKQEGVDILSSNALYVSKRFGVQPAYSQTLQTKYSATVEILDFADASRAVGSINKKVKDDTKGKITELLAADSVNGDTVCVLLSVLYFKGAWAKQFNPSATNPMPFHVPGAAPENPVTVPMMYQKMSVGLFREPRTLSSGVAVDVSYLVVPFVGDDVRFVVEMYTPDPSSGADVPITTLLPMDLDTVLHHARHSTNQRVDVDVYLPRFHVESTLDLIPVLKQSGVEQVFRPSVDLSNIVKGTPLEVTAAMHKVVVEINEAGAEAAAATAIVVTSRALVFSPVFRADHPFHFHIVSVSAEAILFSGTVRDPRKQ